MWPSTTTCSRASYAARLTRTFPFPNSATYCDDWVSRNAVVGTITTKAGVEEILNLQPKGSKAKPYQVKQVRGVIVKYRLAGGNDEK